MNVLFLSELFYPHGSGAELATFLYADLLSKSAFNVRVITNKFEGEADFSRNVHLEIYRFPLFKSSESVKYSILIRIDILFSSFFRKMLNWADVVYIPRFWFSAVPFVKAYGKPVITHLHDYIPICPLSTTFDMAKKCLCKCDNFICPPNCVYSFEKTGNLSFKDSIKSIAFNTTFGCNFPKLIKLSDAVICVSKMQRIILSKSEPALSNKLNVVYNPLPDSENVSLKGNDFGYFGGLNYLKGFQTLNAAVARIKNSSSRSINIHCTKFNNVEKRLAATLKSSGFYLYGKLEKQQYNAIYENISFVVVPSVWPEPWPYIVIEAMLQGRLVIASRIGGIPEQTIDCEGVLLCDPNDSNGFAEKMLLVKDYARETVIDLGYKNRTAFLKRSDNERSIKNLIAIIEKVAET
jgi:glycosyltransferase involved in cell wall biosynthesis